MDFINQSDEEYKKKLSDKQKEMIVELKSSLADLESYAYEVISQITCVSVKALCCIHC